MNFELRIASSLEKVFKNSPLPPEQKKLSLLRGERGAVQLIIRSDENASAQLSFESGLKVRLFRLEEIYAELACYDDFEPSVMLNGAESGYYPDLLRPFEGEVQLSAGENYCLWCELEAGTAGEYGLSFTLHTESAVKSAGVQVQVLNASLPEQTLLHTDWFHTDCLMSHYGFEAFSEEYWRVTENFMKNAAQHGVNLLLTPLFTPALDTQIGSERPTVQLTEVTKTDSGWSFGFEKLDRWVDTAKRSGIKYFEISHFFTQWGAQNAPKIIAQTAGGYRRVFGWETDAIGAEYRAFLKSFGAAFREYTDKKGISESCFVHCSDEPSLTDIEHYRAASDMVREFFPGYRHIDALSDYDFYREGLIETPIPSVNAIESFAGRTPELWTYYCCGQYKDNLPNRFFCMPSIKNRILGVLLYKYNCAGFLHWGFNFYYTQYSLRQINPFEETDAGGKFPSGDSFVVYPGENGEPLSSLRQKVFFEAVQDFAALQALEQKTSRAAALDLISATLGNISFTDYPLDNAVFLSFREKLAAALG